MKLGRGPANASVIYVAALYMFLCNCASTLITRAILLHCVLHHASEEVRHDVMFKLHHALACTINCILLAITHAHKHSWLLKPRFSHYFSEGSEGLSRLNSLLFEDEYRGAEDRAKLQGYIGEPLARSMVDALNEGKKYCLPIYNSH